MQLPSVAVTGSIPVLVAMEKMYNNFAVSIDSFGKKLPDEYYKEWQLKDEQFYVYTFFNEGDYDKNIIQRLSYNFSPKRVFIHHIPYQHTTECLYIFKKWNNHLGYKIGAYGTDGEDFVHACVTIEIVIQYHLTDVVVKRITDEQLN